MRIAQQRAGLSYWPSYDGIIFKSRKTTKIINFHHVYSVDGMIKKDILGCWISR